MYRDQIYLHYQDGNFYKTGLSTNLFKIRLVNPLLYNTVNKILQNIPYEVITERPLKQPMKLLLSKYRLIVRICVSLSPINLHPRLAQNKQSHGEMHVLILCLCFCSCIIYGRIISDILNTIFGSHKIDDRTLEL